MLALVTGECQQRGQTNPGRTGMALRWGPRHPFQGPDAKKVWTGDQGAVCDNRRPMSVLLAFCTCPDADSARRLAGTLVEERLAACVNLLPGMTSVYRWRDAVETADEVQLIIKTTAARLPALAARLAELHPYELPELVAVQAAAGLPAYLAWVTAETSEPREEP